MNNMKLMKFKLCLRLKPKQVKSVCSLLITIMVMGLTGCIIGPTSRMAPLELDKVAKKFDPPAHKSYIYVMRNWTYSGQMITMRVLLKERIDNAAYEREVSFLLHDTYVLFEVSPGKKYEVITGGFLKGIIQLDTLPGRMYFIASEYVDPSPGRPLYIELLPNEVGKRTILNKNYPRTVSSVLEQ